jgi:predicted Zn-ribbon and HTH transcriptional regulator
MKTIDLTNHPRGKQIFQSILNMFLKQPEAECYDCGWQGMEKNVIKGDKKYRCPKCYSDELIGLSDG